MRIIDLHCDTIPRLKELKNQKLYENNIHIDIKKITASKYKAEFFSLFFDKKEVKDALGYVNELYDFFKREIHENRLYIAHAKSYEDLLRNEKENKISAFLTLEGGEALEGKLSNFYDFYNKGIRLITLTWNYANEIGYPNFHYEFRENGLTAFGKDLIEAMNEKKVIIDVSHLSDGGFYQVADISKVPFMASHSNCREVTEHPRNLTDDMIKVIANSGGIIGLNFCNDFLGDKNEAKISSMIKHIRHMYRIGGKEVVALGSDFDGIRCDIEIGDASKMELLYSALKKENFAEDLIDRILYKNAEEFIREVL